MTFPIDNPFFQMLYWVLNTPGVGAFFVGLLGAGLVFGYGMVLRWIAAGGKAAENVIYTYPTVGLHEQEGSSARK